MERTWYARNRKTITGTAFAAPAFLVILVFYVYPALMSFRFSFTDWNGINLKINYVGFDNFIYVIKSPEFKQLIKNTLFLIILYVPILNIISLLFAVIVYDIGKLATFYKVVLYLPNILSMVVVGVIWRVIYNPVFGPLQYVLTQMGLESLVQDWLGQVSTVMPALSISIIWYAVGFYMMIYLGGLSTIPTEIYESASMDGVNKLQKLVYITLPLLAPSITINVVISTIGILTIFDLPFVLTNGGPGFASQTMAIDVYIFAFRSMQQGPAMALAIILTLVTLLFVVLQLKFLRRKEITES
ncbi:sugar ABC transporter permease [Paenibacillus psychroresistens]|uniref:Sugar ABC transporter permease n=1 Tax=Paenibacillus psychroresistens TaxID=1778678 RepID=A0A6B8RE76_9BACL|nr:sugar ABC transporter permease [Paenibacillus psychroresistens]QGQ94771.1 sugar ABC transporter permease [Paenibacillus psychroresistens]